MHPIAERYARDFGLLCMYMVTHPDGNGEECAEFVTKFTSPAFDSALYRASKDYDYMMQLIVAMKSYFDEFESRNRRLLEEWEFENGKRFDPVSLLSFR